MGPLPNMRAIAIAPDFLRKEQFDGESRWVWDNATSTVTFHEPKGESVGTVVLLPGWSGTRAGPADLLVFIASKLARAGWDALRVEMPARGDSYGSFDDIDLDKMITAAQSDSSIESPPVYFLGLC